MAIKFIIDEKKIDRKTCQLTHKAMDKLEHQLILIEQTTPFEKLFNNDAIKYDVLGNNFFTYKFHGDDSSQLRILYRFVRKKSGSFNIECHKVAVKRRTNKNYIKDFEEYVKQY